MQGEKPPGSASNSGIAQAKPHYLGGSFYEGSARDLAAIQPIVPAHSPKLEESDMPARGNGDHYHNRFVTAVINQDSWRLLRNARFGEIRFVPGEFHL